MTFLLLVLLIFFLHVRCGDSMLLLTGKNDDGLLVAQTKKTGLRYLQRPVMRYFTVAPLWTDPAGPLVRSHRVSASEVIWIG